MVDVPLVLVVVWEPLGFVVVEPVLLLAGGLVVVVPLVDLVVEEPSSLVVVIEPSLFCWEVLLVAGVEV